MKTITVFTPTYNRAHLLPRLYKSLCEQSCQDFVWLLIDDGSDDITEELVKKWQKENKIEIVYLYKENGGMHTGHNLAYQNITTELNVCIDSDDWMPEDALELILNKWKSIRNRSKIAGIIGLDADENGDIVGTVIPDNLIKGNLNDLYNRYQVKGDKKLIIRTDIVQQYPPYPEFKNEKLVPLGVLYGLIGLDYDFIYSNEVYCIVEYQPDGSGNTIFRQYKQSPRGFAYSRKISLKYNKGLKNKIKNYIHLTSSAVFAKDISLAFKGVNPVMSLLAFPAGLLLCVYIQIKTMH